MKENKTKEIKKNEEINETLDDANVLESNKKIKDKNDNSLFKKIWNIFAWIILLSWMAICLTDFFKVQNQKDPMFCIKKETIKHDDGVVESCLGPGYKVYNYKRDSFRAIEFGPFWIKERIPEDN